MPTQDTDFISYNALATWVMDRVEQWRTHRDTNYQEKWEEYYRLWRGVYDPGDKTRDSENSKLISPALQQAIEATVAELEEATFGSEQWFDIRDDMMDQTPGDVSYLRKILKEDLEKEGVKEAIAEIFLNGAIYGTGIGKILVEEKTEFYPTQQPIPGTMATQTVVQEVPYICVKIEPVSPQEFLIDPVATNINEALGVATEMMKPRYSIIKGVKDGVYEDVAIGSYSDIDDDYDFESGAVEEDDQVKITEYWGLIPKKYINKNAAFDEFDYDEDDLVEAVVTIANDGQLLRVVENPFLMKDRPFIYYQHDRVPGKFWGRGVAEKGYNMQKALDAELRSRIDALALTTHPMMGIDATRIPRGAKLEVRPGKTILTNGDPSTVLRPMNFGQLDAHTFRESAELERMLSMATGAFDTATSTAAQPRNSTASGMSMIQAASIKRQKRTLMNFQNNFLIPMLNKVINRKIQFDPKRYPLMDYKFIPYSTMGIMAKELEMTQMVQLLSVIPPDSPAHKALVVGVLEASSVQNRDELMQMLMQPPDPQAQQIQQIAMQLQMQKAQADIAEVQAKAQKYAAEAMEKMPSDMKAQEKMLDMQKKLMDMQKQAVDMENIRSETIRNIPEIELIKSKAILNLANARNGSV
jgi:hypothetical protein